jgi:hypothetical protein
MAGCGSVAATVSPAASETEQARALAPQVLSSPVNELTPTEVVTSTTVPFVLDFTPVPTDTPLPTLELPTEAARAPASQAWDGLPTYPAESRPDTYFRVKFDPDAWALTIDAFGSPALVHRAISNCVIAPSAGRGLPANATTEKDMRRLGGISYQISSTFVNGVKQFVTYAAGDGRIYTAFQVSLDERPDQCLLEAETVLSTLTSVSVSDATPIATP